MKEDATPSESTEEREGREIRYGRTWGKLSRKMVHLLRHKIPKTTPWEVETGGRVKIETLRNHGVELNKEEASELSRGMGAGGKIRFEAEEKEIAEGEEATMMIRLAKTFARLEMR